MTSQLSFTARNILARIAGGQTYEQILCDLPHLTDHDIFNAAREALMMLGLEPIIPVVDSPHKRDNSGDEFSSVIIQPGS